MYEIQYNKITRGCSKPFSNVNFVDHYVPNRSETLMINAVTDGLMRGIFYTSDLNMFIRDRLKNELSEELISQGIQKVEFGHFGMDVYHCRQAVEYNLTCTANINALKKLTTSDLINVGAKFTNIQYSNSRFSTIKVTEINNKDGLIIFEGSKRGTRNKWGFGLGANDRRLLSQLSAGLSENKMTLCNKDEGRGLFCLI